MILSFVSTRLGQVDLNSQYRTHDFQLSKTFSIATEIYYHVMILFYILAILLTFLICTRVKRFINQRGLLVSQGRTGRGYLQIRTSNMAEVGSGSSTRARICTFTVYIRVCYIIGHFYIHILMN